MTHRNYPVSDGQLALKYTEEPWGELYPAGGEGMHDGHGLHDSREAHPAQNSIHSNRERALDFLDRLAGNYRAISSSKDGLKSRLKSPIIVRIKPTKDTGLSEQDLVERIRNSIETAHTRWKTDRILQKRYPCAGEGMAYIQGEKVLYRVTDRIPESQGKGDSVGESRLRSARRRVSYL